MSDDESKESDNKKAENENKTETKKTSDVNKNVSKMNSTLKHQGTTSSSGEKLFNAKSIPKMEAATNNKIKLTPIFLILLALILITFSGWNFYQLQISNQTIQSIKEQTNKDITQQKLITDQTNQESTQTVAEINQIKQGLQHLANFNNDLKLQLLSAQEKIKSLSGRRKQDWMLAEVEYLINIAELKISLQKDRKTAIQLLKTADEKLIEIADQSYLPIREAIARDISSLNLIQESDITGIVIALNALEDQITDLDLLALKFEDPISENLKDNNSNDDDLENYGNTENNDEGILANVDKIYQRFISEFIVIKNHAEAPQPLMTPKQRGNLNQNIQLALQQAQIAAMQGNEPLYRVSLEKAVKWISTYFGHGAKPSATIDELKQLIEKPIDVRYPSHLEVTKVIKSVNKEQLYQWLDTQPKSTNHAPQELLQNKAIDPVNKNEKPTEPNL